MIPRKLVLSDYLRRKQPEVMCLAETKKIEDILFKTVNNSKV